MQYVLGGATVLAGGALYYLSTHGPPPMREHKPRGDIRKVDGVDMHIVVNGPKDGDRILMLHGFGSHSFVFDHIMDHLVEQGYRVCTFDFQGFGHSDLPPGTRLDSEYYTQQVRSVVKAIGWDKGVFSLMGFSMGGAVSMLYTASYPDNVNRLILIAPAGMPVPMPLKSYFVKAPVLGELIARHLGPHMLYKRYTQMIRYGPTPEDVRDHLLHSNLYIATGPSKERYFEATISTLRNFPLQHGIPHIVQELGAHERPVLFCWGTDDDVVPYTNSQAFLRHMPKATLKTLDDCGHLCYKEKPEEFHAMVDEFLQTT